MSEEQNDSPAFRLRPRRAAPKSYYTVRLEYSANPSAFIRERPREKTKRRVFSSKTGSQQQNQRYPTQQSNDNGTQPRQTHVLTKEERELELKRMSLKREISESITDSKMISPFMQRLSLNELKPDTVYEHNYITVRIKKIRRSTNNQLAYCLCESVEDDDDDAETLIDSAEEEERNGADSKSGLKDTDSKSKTPPPPPQSPATNEDNRVNYTGVSVRLHNEYAATPLLKPNKLISLAKFKTSPMMPEQCVNYETTDESTSPSLASSTPITTTINQTNFSIDNDNINDCTNTNSSDNSRLPFIVIVKYDELNRNSSPSIKEDYDLVGNHQQQQQSLGTLEKNRSSNDYLIPFLSVTDFAERPIEPFVEISPPSPGSNTNSNNNYNHHHLRNHSHAENTDYRSADYQDTKKVKFTATV